VPVGRLALATFQGAQPMHAHACPLCQLFLGEPCREAIAANKAPKVSCIPAGDCDDAGWNASIAAAYFPYRKELPDRGMPSPGLGSG
jgi:hypothetical protein